MTLLLYALWGLGLVVLAVLNGHYDMPWWWCLLSGASYGYLIGPLASL